MERLTTDNPQNNTQNMLNYAYAKDGNAILRYGDGQEDIDLCEYISRLAAGKGCSPAPEEVMDGACMDCDCELAILYWVAVQAAELRGRLKAYEDNGQTPGEQAAMMAELTTLREANRWIPIAERIPTKQAADKRFEVEVIDRHGTYWFVDWCDRRFQEKNSEFTHWRPLPEGPQEREGLNDA